jgi:hypothetical protein
VPRKGVVARTFQRRLLFLFTHLRTMHVTETAEKQSQPEQPESTTPTKQSSRKSVLALAVFALGINTTAAIYTLPTFDIPLPNVSTLAELLPLPKASEPAADPALAALKDIQSAQQQHVALLQQSTALLQQDSITLASLRQSVGDEHADVKKISSQIADEHQDVKKISAQISTLIAKVDSLKNAMSPEVTSSIPSRHARNRLSSVARKKIARQPMPVGPVSLGGAPLTLPALTAGPQG